MTELELRCAVVSSEPVVILSHDERIALGLSFWCDGTMGVVRGPMQTLVVSPNGPCVATHDISAGGFSGGLLSSGTAISQPRRVMDHASGGPVLVDPLRDHLVLIYHGETFAGDDADDYYSFIGLARSVDGGRSFEDLGTVVELEHLEGDPDRMRPVEIGSGSPIVHDGNVYFYFQDRSIKRIHRNLCVARVRVNELFAATRSGTVPVLTKFHEGRWSSPGLGGPGDDLLAGRDPPVLWSDTAFVERIGMFMVVYATVVDVVAGVAQWMHMLALSEDGVRWGEAVPLYERPVVGEILYLTIDSGGRDQRRIEGAGFDLYRVWSDRKRRWENARLERVRVSFV